MDLQASTSPEADPRLNEGAPDVPTSDQKGQHDVSQQLSRDTLCASQPDPDAEKTEVVQDGGNDSTTPNEELTTDARFPDGLVEFDGPNDPDNPKNFTTRRKWAITFSIGWLTFVVTFASSIFSVAADSVSQEFGVDRVVSILGVSLFLLVCCQSSSSPSASRAPVSR